MFFPYNRTEIDFRGECESLKLKRRETVLISALILVNQCLGSLNLGGLQFILNPVLFFVVGFYSGSLFYRSIRRSFVPAKRIALTYLFSVGIEYLCIGLMGFTSFDFLAGFAQIMAASQPFAAMNLVRVWLANSAHPLQNYQYSNWPQTPDQWAWSSVVLTIVGVIALVGAIAIARRWSIGLRVWLALSILFGLASIANVVLLFTVGQPYQRGFFGPFVSIAWAISYAAAYWIVRERQEFAAG